MVTEFAEIEVKPGMEQTFVDGVTLCKPVFLRAPGCLGMALQRSVEQPSKFMLIVEWESVAHHMELFRHSSDFAIWRGAVGDCFAAPPHVWHGETVV